MSDLRFPAEERGDLLAEFAATMTAESVEREKFENPGYWLRLASKRLDLQLPPPDDLQLQRAALQVEYQRVSAIFKRTSALGGSDDADAVRSAPDAASRASTSSREPTRRLSAIEGFFHDAWAELFGSYDKKLWLELIAFSIATVLVTWLVWGR